MAMLKDVPDCIEWQGCSSTIFYVANVLHLGAFFVPHNFSASGLVMRSLICVGQLLFASWGSLRVCAADIVAWNIALVVVNIVHIISISIRIAPPIIPDHFKDLYVKLFQPLKVNRRQFKALLKDTEVRWLESGEVYAQEDVTLADTRLSVLLSGKVRVSCDNAHLHYVFPNQFIDSPEWEAAEYGNSDQCFQVTVIAEERSQYVTWKRHHLKALLSHKPFLNSIMDCLLGKDITAKLYSLSEYQIKSRQNNMRKMAEESQLLRSHSVDTVHVGNSGLVRSDVWVSQKRDSINDNEGNQEL